VRSHPGPGLMIMKQVSVIDKQVFITADFSTPEKMLPELQSGITRLLGKQNLAPVDIASLGVSCGGPLDSRKGVVMSPPNLPGWDDVHIVSFFEKNFSIPAALQNDANACALAEWKFGAGRGQQEHDLPHFRHRPWGRTDTRRKTLFRNK